jgi:glycosyltransferase involved in cell wall biosynthesis
VPGGDENRLADAMIKLAQEDRNQLQILIEKAQKRIKDNFTPAVVIRRLEKIYEDCMIKNA